MTALNQYQRLEASGLWRADPQAQRRDVVVSMGDATLTITDAQDRVLAHWSLAAVARANRGSTPAFYHPDGDPGETLELAETEAEMIEAIERVRRAVERRRPQPGKLRVWITGTIATLVAGLVIFWLPGALLRHTVKVVPMVKRVEIGDALLDRITRVAGAPCAAPQAREPLRHLAERVLGEDGAESLVVLRDGVRETVHLPGGRILLNRALIEDPEDPDVTAGYIVAETVRRDGSDPLDLLLRHAGLWSSLQLLTTGSLPDSVLDDYAEYLLVRDPAPQPLDRLTAAFAAADLRSTPYAYAEDMTGEGTLQLIEADPRRSEGSRQVLSDADWVRLQGICGG